MLTTICTAAAVPVLLACAYLCVLTLLSRRLPVPVYGPPRVRFDLVVPAHDEEAGVATTIRSLLALDYPPERRRVIVVADNCTDRTAASAREAGALAIERHDPVRAGKGDALEFAFQRSLAEGFADAIVVVDADTIASPNLLNAFSTLLEAGAMATQAFYGVRNGADSWRTRLIAIGFSLFHRVRSLGRERLRLSAGLRGNGMCFLRQVPHDAHSVVEDLEYGIKLGLAGHRVHYADDAWVLGEMASTERASRSQRRRWESGRFQILKRYGLRLFASSIRRFDAALLDLAVDVLLPPLARVATVAGLGLALSGMCSLVEGHVDVSVYPWSVCCFLLCVYVLRGWWLSETGLRGLFDLLLAPAYVTWKATLLFRSAGHPKDAWTRTLRQGELNDSSELG